MKQKINKLAPALLMFVLLALQTSCYKDNKETMYPSTTICDTSKVTFNKDIMQIVTNSCNKSGCHNGSGRSITLTTYAAIKAIANDGTFVSYINSGEMPKNAAKLDNCSINKITFWVNAGAPNN